MYSPMHLKNVFIYDFLCSVSVKISWNWNHIGTCYFDKLESFPGPLSLIFGSRIICLFFLWELRIKNCVFPDDQCQASKEWPTVHQRTQLRWHQTPLQGLPCCWLSSLASLFRSLWVLSLDLVTSPMLYFELWFLQDPVHLDAYFAFKVVV